jgi:hypothetical protein
MIDELDEGLDESVQRLTNALRDPVPVRAEWRTELISRIEREMPVSRGWTMRPWMAMAAAMLIFAVGIIAGRASRATVGSSPASAAATPTAAVRFVYVAPNAQSVALVGDFNQWNPSAVPLKRLADGTWITDLPLSPGRYAYAFLVDGKLVADPAAPRATSSDDFGFANSVLMVRGL